MQPIYFTRFTTTEDQLDIISSICSFMTEKKKGDRVQLVCFSNDYKLVVTNGIKVIFIEESIVWMYQPMVMETINRSTVKAKNPVIVFAN
jgi:hypothetical protein